MKKALLYGVFSLFILSFQAKADFFQSLKNQNFDEALTEIQSLQDVNQKDEDGWTALMYAARLGQIEMAKVLIEKGADLEAKNHAGLTPYLWAAYAGHVDMMKFLAEKGANVNQENAYHENALDIAAGMGEKKVVEYILSATKDEVQKEKMAQNSIYLTQDEEIKNLLIQAGAVETDPSKQTIEEDDEGNESQKEPTQEELTAFMTQTHPEFAIILALNEDNDEKALSLINQTPQLNSNFRTNNGWNLLYLAAIKNKAPLIQPLIQKGFDVNDMAAEFKTTPLILALAHHQKEAALELLKTPDILIDYQDEKERNARSLILESQDNDLINALNDLVAKPVSSVTEHVIQDLSTGAMEKPVEEKPAAQEDALANKSPSSNMTKETVSDKPEASPYSYH